MPHPALRACALVVVLSALPVQAAAQVTVSVDALADRHPISPLIYGMNFTSAAQAAAARIPLTRWGGNGTSRYNYQIDVSNTGADYYFENVAGCWNAGDGWCANPPKDPQAASGANAFLDGATRANMVALLTVPTLGWVAKAPPKYGHPFDCGCPRSALAQQDSFDPYDMNCGNGKRGGAWLTCPVPTTTSVAADPSWTASWVSYLVNKFGPSGGKRIYALDNEPNLWSSTHHDVHPAPLTYEELWQRMRDHAVKILDADPGAEISGPAEWGWPNYLCSDADDISKGCLPNSPDRANHGGKELVAWLLEQARDYEKQNGRRILHYLDLHYYPMGGNSPQNTRSLWDPNYSDPSWINEKIRLIPRMKDWVAQHYPGTRLMISEYDFYHHDEAVGAVTYAEVLGLFGREGLDAATAWAPPGEKEAAFGAFMLYRNYGFESTSVRASVSGNGVAAFAAVGSARLTVALINENNASSPMTVAIAGFTPVGMAHLYSGNGVNIAQQPDLAVAGGTVALTLPPLSIAVLVVDGMGPQLPDMAAPSDLAAGGAGDGGAAPSGDLAMAIPMDWGPRHDAAGASACSCRMGNSANGPSTTPGPGPWAAWLMLLLLVRRLRLR